MAQINPYLTFNGNCLDAFDFYKFVFEKEYKDINYFKDMPSEKPMSEELGNKIMHVHLPISAETNLFGSDVDEAFGAKSIAGNNVTISINAESVAEADKLFNGLSKDGEVTMPLAKTFWGAYFGMFTDKFGIHWMINYDFPKG